MERQVVPVKPDTKLLDEYLYGKSFFLSSPQGTLLAEGMFAKVPDDNGHHRLESLPARVEAVLSEAKRSGYRNPVVVGAVPFDPESPAHLIVPETIRWSGPLSFDADIGREEGPKPSFDIHEVPKAAEFVRGVEQALERMNTDDELCKIVLSRSLELTSTSKVDIHQLLRHLAAHNTSGYTFAVDLPEPASRRRTLVGASPELLVSKSGRQVLANPLAGSAAAVKIRSRTVGAGTHCLFRKRICTNTRSLSRRSPTPFALIANGWRFRDRPSLLKTPTMWHLSTEVRGELADPSTSSVALAASLHPTPAVCGSPTDRAREAIREIEPFDRHFYTGMVGWCNDSGDGEWVVTIRCAEVGERFLRLYAGAGIVAGSKPEAELAETSAKFRTMLQALGLHEA